MTIKDRIRAGWRRRLITHSVQNVGNGLPTMPTTIRAGDLAVIAAFAEDNTTTPPASSTPIGWTLQGTTTVVRAADAARAEYYTKILDGTEGGTTYTIVNRDYETALFMVFRPVYARIASATALGLGMDFQKSGAGLSTQTVSLAAVSHHYIAGGIIMGGLSSTSTDLTAEGSFVASPAPGADFLIRDDNDTTANTIRYTNAGLWEGRYRPTNIQAGIGDVLSDFQQATAWAIGIDLK